MASWKKGMLASSNRKQASLRDLQRPWARGPANFTLFFIYPISNLQSIEKTKIAAPRNRLGGGRPPPEDQPTAALHCIAQHCIALHNSARHCIDPFLGYACQMPVYIIFRVRGCLRSIGSGWCWLGLAGPGFGT